MDAAAQTLNEPVPPTDWRHEVVDRIHAPRARVTLKMPQVVGYLSAVDAETTDFHTGKDNPAEAAQWLTCFPFEFPVLGDKAVYQATKELAQRLLGAVHAQPAPPQPC